MVANITFLSFLLFSMCQTIQVVVNTWLNCSFFYINNIIAAAYKIDTMTFASVWDSRLSLDFFDSGLHTYTAVARLTLALAKLSCSNWIKMVSYRIDVENAGFEACTVYTLFLVAHFRTIHTDTRPT